MELSEWEVRSLVQKSPKSLKTVNVSCTSVLQTESVTVTEGCYSCCSFSSMFAHSWRGYFERWQTIDDVGLRLGILWYNKHVELATEGDGEKMVSKQASSTTRDTWFCRTLNCGVPFWFCRHYIYVSPQLPSSLKPSTTVVCHELHETTCPASERARAQS